MTGWMADRMGLFGALQWLPVPATLAAITFMIGSREKALLLHATEAA